jgi:Nucleotidyl transferase AbiEii toxin, Type IV TA system
MPLRELHQRIAAIALRASGQHGFALGGGNALIAHGVISRPTQDIDLVTNMETGVGEAAGPLEAALLEAGYRAERQPRDSDLSDLFPGLGDELADYHITGPGGDLDLQLAYFDRRRDPVLMDFGPVLDLEDVAGSKLCALIGRAYDRDYLDTAALLDRWTPAELIALARRLDPGLDPRDIAAVPARLEQMSDRRFTAYQLSPQEIAAVRGRFADWPRTADAAGLA